MKNGLFNVELKINLNEMSERIRCVAIDDELLALDIIEKVLPANGEYRVADLL